MMTGNYYDVAFGIILVAVLFFFGVRKIQKQNNISKVVDISENHKTNTKYFVSELNDDKRSVTMKFIIDNADTCYSTCINKNTKKY